MKPAEKAAIAVAVVVGVYVLHRIAQPKRGNTHTHTHASNVPRRKLVVSRIHFGSAASSVLDISKLRAFAAHAKLYANTVLFIISLGDNLEHLQTVTAAQEELAEPDGTVIVQGLTPWGKFTPALNAGVSYAAKAGYDTIIFQSLEALVSAEGINRMLDHLTADTLVVGAALDGHKFSSGRQRLSGVTCPWNTLAAWNTYKLCLTGFAAIGDGYTHTHMHVEGGVEEVSTVSLLQRIRSDCKAKLVEIPDVRWHTTWSDPLREQWHLEKMKSKESRAAAQLRALGILGGVVEHIALTY